MKKFKIVLVLLLMVMFIPFVKAEEDADLLKGDTLTVTSEEYEDVMYFHSGDSVIFDKNINGNSFVAGSSVTVKNDSKGILFTAGSDVIIDGSADYGFIAGATVNGSIRNDLYIAGSTVNISKDAVIGRDITIFGSTVTIEGIIERDITISASKVIIKNASINGNITIDADNISIEENVAIAKTLKYGESSKITIASGAVIGAKETFDDTVSQMTFAQKAYQELTATCTLLVTFAVVALIFPKLFNKINKLMHNVEPITPLINAGKGAILLITVPLLALVLLFTVFGSSLALIIFGFYMLFIYMTKLLIGYMIGYLIWKKFIKKDENVFLMGLIGIMTLYVLALIPFVSTIVSIAVLLIGLGYIFDLIKKERAK